MDKRSRELPPETAHEKELERTIEANEEQWLAAAAEKDPVKHAALAHVANDVYKTFPEEVQEKVMHLFNARREHAAALSNSEDANDSPKR